MEETLPNIGSYLISQHICFLGLTGIDFQASFSIINPECDEAHTDLCISLFERCFGAQRNIVLRDLVAGIDEANNNTIIQTLYVLHGHYEFSETLVVKRKYDIIGIIKPLGQLEIAPNLNQEEMQLFDEPLEDDAVPDDPVAQPAGGAPDAPEEETQDPAPLVVNHIPEPPLALDAEDIDEEASDHDLSADDAIDAVIFADEVDDLAQVNHFPRLHYEGSGSMFLFDLLDSEKHQNIDLFATSTPQYVRSFLHPTIMPSYPTFRSDTSLL